MCRTWWSPVEEPNNSIYSATSLALRLIFCFVVVEFIRFFRGALQMLVYTSVSLKWTIILAIQHWGHIQVSSNEQQSLCRKHIQHTQHSRDAAWLCAIWMYDWHWQRHWHQHAGGYSEPICEAIFLKNDITYTNLCCSCTTRIFLTDIQCALLLCTSTQNGTYLLVKVSANNRSDLYVSRQNLLWRDQWPVAQGRWVSRLGFGLMCLPQSQAEQGWDWHQGRGLTTCEG